MDLQIIHVDTTRYKSMLSICPSPFRRGKIQSISKMSAIKLILSVKHSSVDSYVFAFLFHFIFLMIYIVVLQLLTSKMWKLYCSVVIQNAKVCVLLSLTWYMQKDAIGKYTFSNNQ